MRANGHVVSDSKINGRTHRTRIARVKSAGDVRGRNVIHELGIIAAAFAHVAIQINLQHFDFAIYTRRGENSIQFRTA